MSEEIEVTTFDNKCIILAELWIDYRDSSDLADYVDYNDMGLPLAFLLSEKLVKVESPYATKMILESFDQLLTTLGVDDTGFYTLEELMIG